jgi:hypothetical protein
MRLALITTSVVAAWSLAFVAFWSRLNSAAHTGPQHQYFRKELLEYEEKAENPQARLDQEFQMLRDPRTNAIPRNIHRAERDFAAKLPSAELTSAEALAQTQLQNNGLSKTPLRGAQVQSEAWISRGPFFVGGRTRAFAVDVTNENVMLAAGISGGIWRSTNGGQSWVRVSPIGGIPNVSCLVQDTRPGKTNIWYAGTGEGIANSASGGSAPMRGDGIYKSTDGGNTWSLLASTSTNTPQRFDQRFDYVWNIAINPRNMEQDEVYAAVFETIFRSTDGGATWRAVLGATGSLPTTTGFFSDIAIGRRSGVMYATLSDISGMLADQRGIFRSTDGTNWTRIAPDDFPRVYRRITIGIAPSNENVAYFVAETPNSGFQGFNDGEAESHSLWKYTYLSGDGTFSGGRWENRTNNLPALGGAARRTGDFITQNSYDIVIAPRPDNENVVFLGGTNLYRSTDGFASSTNTAWIGGYATNQDFSILANHYVDQHVITFSPTNPLVMFTGNDGGVFRTDNCMAAQIAWTPLNNGYLTAQFYAIAIHPTTSGSPLLVGGMQDNSSQYVNSLASRSQWVRALSGDGGFCAVAQDGSTLFVSAQNGTVYRRRFSQDFSRPLGTALIKPSGGSGYLFINPFVLDPASDNVLYLAGGQQLWRHDDLTRIPNGNDNETSSGWTMWDNFTRQAGERVSALGAVNVGGNVGGNTGGGGASGASGTRLFVGTTAGRLWRIDNAQTGRSTPTELRGTTFPGGAYVSCIACDRSDANRAIVVFSNYNVPSLFLTEDGGATWTNISGNLEQFPDGTGNGPSCRWASILTINGTVRVFVGTSTGLYSTNRLNGTNTMWTQEGTSTIGSAVVTMVVSRASDGLVVAATHGNGVFAANVSVASDGQFGQGVVLRQNFPNPFAQATGTTIIYDLPEQALVNLAVYDVLGNRVATLVNAVQQQGQQQVRWEGTSDAGTPLAGGLYVYRLTAARAGTTVLRTGQMILQ